MTPAPSSPVAKVPAEPGMWASLRGFLAASANFLSVRLSLASLEAREAGIRWGLAVAFGVAALVVILLGYIFLALAATYGVARLIGGPNAWLWALLLAALGHFGGAVVLLLAAKKRATGAVFAETIHQLKQDQTWLKTGETN